MHGNDSESLDKFADIAIAQKEELKSETPPEQDQSLVYR